MRSLAVVLLCAVAVGASPQDELAKIFRLRPRDEPQAVARADDRVARRILQPASDTPEAEALQKAQALREREEEEEAAAEANMKWTVVVSVLALAATFIIGFILESNHVHWFPEAAVGVLIGFACARTARLYGNEYMLESETFNYEFFMLFLLPPIIFEAGFNMNVSAFFKNLGPTMFFAFVGTFASTFVVGGIVYVAGIYGFCYPLGLLAALTFGALISATDPVTVLAVFQALGVKVDLFSMVFGESVRAEIVPRSCRDYGETRCRAAQVLNDAVAIVLVSTLGSFNGGAPVNAETVGAAGVLFTTIFVGSMVRGHARAPRAHPAAGAEACAPAAHHPPRARLRRRLAPSMASARPSCSSGSTCATTTSSSSLRRRSRSRSRGRRTSRPRRCRSLGSSPSSSAASSWPYSRCTTSRRARRISRRRRTR